MDAKVENSPKYTIVENTASTIIFTDVSCEGINELYLEPVKIEFRIKNHKSLHSIHRA